MRTLRNWVRRALLGIAYTVGCGVFCFGVALIYLPAGYMVAGALLAACGWLFFSGVSE